MTKKPNHVDNHRLRRDFVPASDYLSPVFQQREMERLWPRVWQIACREEEIPNVGDYVTYEIATESILIVRDTDNSIKALHNVCSHRGRRLQDDARGNVRQFRCNYHAWRYKLDGQLLSVPSRDDWQDCPDFDQSSLSLKRVIVDLWAGFVWINMDTECGSLMGFLGTLPGKIDPFAFEDCRLLSYKTLYVPVNWKVVLEAFIEGYHTTGTHPQLLRFGSPFFPASEVCGTDDHLHATHTAHFERPPAGNNSPHSDPRIQLHGMVEELHRTLGALYHETSLRAAGRLIDEVPQSTPVEDVYGRFFEFQREEIIKSGAKWPPLLTQADLWSTDWQIFPNSSVLPAVDGGLWYRMRPNGDDPESCIFDIWVLGRLPPGEAHMVEHEIFPDLESFAGQIPFLEQDFANLVAVQKGMRSRAWPGARTSPVQEVSVYNLHRVLRRYLFDDDELFVADDREEGV